MTAENQRENVRIAAKALAPITEGNQLVISHGNGPQVGLLALQSAAYEEVEAYPLDVLGAQTEGMIGYMIEQELGTCFQSKYHLLQSLQWLKLIQKTQPSKIQQNQSDLSTTMKMLNFSRLRKDGQ